MEPSQDESYFKELDRRLEALLAASSESKEDTPDLSVPKIEIQRPDNDAMSSNDSPPIVRPIPRRPFDLNITTGPSKEGDNDTEHTSRPSSPGSSKPLVASFLSPGAPAADDDSSISRATSMMNLTSSTLSGIYAPTEEPETPWGTGSQTPIKRFTLQEQQDFSAIELDKEHSSMLRRRLSSTTRSPPRELPRRSRFGSDKGSISGLASRALLLFALGMGYGMLVTRLRNGSRSSHHSTQHLDLDDEFSDSDGSEATGAEATHAAGIMHPGTDWRYLVFWGVIGVILGGLLPWFDGVWEKAFRDGADSSAIDLDPVVAMEQMNKQREQDQKTPNTPDWALVVRGIGAFVGIVFAIRRLPWTSSLQASATLALINPFLWYIIDRSKPGFLLSAFVGFTGSAVLLGLNREMMMPPVGGPSVPGKSSSDYDYANFNTSASSCYPGQAAMGNNLMLGGLATQETVESGVWMLSVLFCSVWWRNNSLDPKLERWKADDAEMSGGFEVIPVHITNGVVMCTYSSHTQAQLPFRYTILTDIDQAKIASCTGKRLEQEQEEQEEEEEEEEQEEEEEEEEAELHVD
ncbi:putative insig domain-containing protein [Zalerion maritima]|uniref:Insig domain-containing protein n=1 Tax=Zalerion maritima TaxID=339359 RepID=A0AAD5WPG6_9PEZI|nr:putative insig domain-containing protein [Zalerion maritima]